jgi:hypothetical protein
MRNTGITGFGMRRFGSISRQKESRRQPLLQLWLLLLLVSRQQLLLLFLHLLGRLALLLLGKPHLALLRLRRGHLRLR